MLTIDFETRSRIDLKKTGAHAYAKDKSTEILCMAYGFETDELTYGNIIKAKSDIQLGNNQDFVKLIEYGEGLPKEVIDYIKNTNGLIEAHNVQFERAIWENVGVKRLGWPEIAPERWRCTMSRCVATALPRGLDGALDALNAPINKDKSGHRIMLQMTKPRKPTKNNPNEWFSEPEKFEMLYKYCMIDVLAEMYLSTLIPELSDNELMLWQLDQEINFRGVRVDVESARKIESALAKYVEKENENLAEKTNGVLSNTNSPMKLKAYATGFGYLLPNTQEETVLKVLDDPAVPEKIKEVLKTRRRTGAAAVKKLTAMQKRACPDGRARGCLVYHGAHTGRWSGEGIQTQNMKRCDPKLANDYIDRFTNSPNPVGYFGHDIVAAASQCVRGMLIPADGATFVGGDFSGIEARNLLWASKDVDGLKNFEPGNDIYKVMACSIFGVRDQSLVTGEQRQVGKQAILGLGYGMGSAKFMDTCDKAGIKIGEDLASKTVGIYRQTFHRVPKFWAAMESLFRSAIAKPGAKFAYVISQHAAIEVIKSGDHLYVKLPSHRILTYRNSHIDEFDRISYTGVNSYTRKYEKLDTYGGKLVENVVQAMSRDLLAYSIEVVEMQGYPVVLHTHDELLNEIFDFVDSDLQNYKRLFGMKPGWAQGMPIDVEVWSGTRYGKG